MGQELGGSQITALLETVPGIASVLRSPVADALVNMIRAGAGVSEFREEDVRELVQYSVRRGLIGADEGDRLTAEVAHAGRRSRARPVAKTEPKAVHRLVHKPSKRPSPKKVKTASKKRR